MNKQISGAIKSSDKEKYSHPIPDRDFILNLLNERDTSMNRHQLADAMQLYDEQEQEALRRRLRAMERDNQVIFHPRKGYSVLRADELVTGTVIGHPDGFGFLSRDEGGDDLFLFNKQMESVFDGDRVQVRISGVDRRGRQEGKIVKVLEHNTTQLVGRLAQDEDGVFFLEPENRRITNEIDIDEEDLAGAKLGQYISVEILEQPCSRYNATGRVIEVLGDSMAPGMEIDVALRSHDIPHRWPQDALKAAESLGNQVAAADKAHRVDLRKLPFVTIDGEDARDFDDAVYCEKSGSGWKLYVAIADVSHYVKPDSTLDIEARERGTSVYFPGHVVPMLPEALSNGLCSLNPKVDRLVMVCEMAINSAGKMTDFSFSEGVIHSHARLTYNQVGALLSDPTSGVGKQVAHNHKAIVPHLHELHALYGALRKARSKRGSIDFETREVQFRFNEDRKIEQIVPVVRNDAHKMIEEFMLCANVATAGFLEQLQIPALYRIHDGPLEKKLKNLRAFLGERGLNLGGGDKPTPADYDKLLTSLGDRSDAHIIRTMMLRSLSQAEYSPDNQGHFGLAYSAYAHFTSPIRRYPDLLVHRAIRSVIRRKETGSAFHRALKRITGKGTDPVQRVKNAPRLEPAKAYPYDMQAMLILAEHCSEASRRADQASWDVEAWLKCEYMQDFIGDTFTGIISSVAKFGLFIEIEDIQVEGLIHVSALKSDFYHFDEAKQRLVGDQSRTTYALGDAVEIRVVRVDMDQRKIDFELVDTQARTTSRKKKRKPKH
ncbi:ribonuclease R [Pontibacterium granulatum]|uniref:ribonuclease R n=1 Tax=Pontibacterium granulatum TaxID=2036029 RepID=UPI00249CC41F|nr:ribonuclease R [Pontibacterium granulatum]MDI3324517.1 ribonuclease R [Pontibacterium granulatum]